MRITFLRFPEHGSSYSVIERDDGVVYRLRGSTRAGTVLPHDLEHLLVERELRVGDGIWGGIAAGMVFGSMEHVSGRRPPHAAERSGQLKRAQRERIMRAEMLVNLVEAVAGLPLPSEPQIEQLARTKLSVLPRTEPGLDLATAVALPPAAVLAAAARVLQVEAARWARLRPGQELVYEWPGPVTRRAPDPLARQLPRLVPPPRAAAGHRDPRRPGRPGAR
jgi:hypothetical protein